MMWPDSGQETPSVMLSYVWSVHIIVCVCFFCHVQRQLAHFISLVCLSRDKHTWRLSFFFFFFNLPVFVACLQLILDWLSLPFLSGSRGSLVSSSDAIETPAAVHCCARVCEGVYVFNSPPLLAFDVSLVCQLTKCTGAAPTAKTHHRFTNSYVRCKHTLIFMLACTCSGQESCNYRWSAFITLIIARLPLTCFPSSSGRRGIVGLSLGWTWIRTPACCCCYWLCQRHNGAESGIIPSFSLLTASLLQILLLHFVLLSICLEWPK